MKQPAIPIIDPSLFVRQFLDETGHERASQLNNGEVAGPSPSDFFTLMRIEDFAPFIRFPIPAHRSFHFDFILLTRGTMQRTYGLQAYSLSSASFTCYRAGDIMSTDACSTDATGYYGLFDASYLLGTFKNPRILDELNFLQPDTVPVLLLDADTEADWIAQLGRMERAFKQDRPDRHTYMSTLLYSFLLDVQRQFGQQASSRKVSTAERLTDRFRQLLAREILTHRSVSSYADWLAVTPNHLNRCVKETTGKAASTLIAEMLVLEAKVLLRQSDLSISEVAERLHFEDLSYFGRFMRKHAGMSPSEYRLKA